MPSLCIIIVNDHLEADEFEFMENRPGAWEEAMKLKDVLQSHGDFEFRVHRNIDAQEMYDYTESGE